MNTILFHNFLHISIIKTYLIHLPISLNYIHIHIPSDTSPSLILLIWGGELAATVIACGIQSTVVLVATAALINMVALQYL
jgi:hypothetical protein